MLQPNQILEYWSDPFKVLEYSPPDNANGLQINVRYHLFRHKKLFRKDDWYVVRFVSDSYDYYRNGEPMCGGCRYIDWKSQPLTKEQAVYHLQQIRNNNDQ